jgi:hypothetical protein
MRIIARLSCRRLAIRCFMQLLAVRLLAHFSVRATLLFWGSTLFWLTLMNKLASAIRETSAISAFFADK